MPSSPTAERILAAALKLFAESGFDATSTKAIAAEAGVPDGLVFYYFGNKARLLDALFDADNVYGAVRAIVDDGPVDDPAAMFRVLAHQLFRWFLDHDDLARLFVKETTSHREIAARLLALRGATISLIARCVQREIDAKRLARVNPRLVAQVLFSTVQQAAIVDHPGEIAGFVDDLVSILMQAGGGVRGRRGR